MANDLNRCDFIGRLGADPELKYMPSGNAVANIRLAVGESWKDKQTGERREHTEWVPVTIYGKLAEIASQYLNKGSRIYVSGKFKTRKWQDQSGQDRYTTEVVVDISGQMQMLDSKPDNQAGESRSSGQAAPRQAPAQSSQPAGDDFDDQDIPF